jgi:hypothetical protein
MWIRAELKERAKSVLRTNYWMAFLISLVIVFVSGSCLLACGGGSGGTTGTAGATGMAGTGGPGTGDAGTSGAAGGAGTIGSGGAAGGVGGDTGGPGGTGGDNASGTGGDSSPGSGGTMAVCGVLATTDAPGFGAPALGGTGTSTDKFLGVDVTRDDASSGILCTSGSC